MFASSKRRMESRRSHISEETCYAQRYRMELILSIQGGISTNQLILPTSGQVEDSPQESPKEKAKEKGQKAAEAKDILEKEEKVLDQLNLSECHKLSTRIIP